jgi:hypothetical protein
MTVAELIEELKKYPADSQLLSHINYYSTKDMVHISLFREIVRSFESSNGTIMLCDYL